MSSLLQQPASPAADGGGSLERLIAPRSIAVIGASPDGAKLSGRPLRYLLRYGFEGRIYPVNGKYQEIEGIRCFPSVEALPEAPDLALILLPAGAVAESLEACGRRGIPFAISIAGGFAEAGDAAAQQRLQQIVAETGIRLIGPNCVGLLNPRGGVTATFSTELRRAMPRPGSIALVTQSGALGNSLLQSFNDLDLPLGAWVSTGNEADLGVLDLVEHFLGDPEIDTIALFIEGLKDGRRLVPLGRAARAAGKTLVVLRAGRSQAGRAAAVSHTGKLAGASKVWQSVARQAGLIEVTTLDALLDVLLCLSAFGPRRTAEPEGLGVLTISGGLGVLISDWSAEAGLPVPALSDETRQRLRAVLPPQMTVANPVDTALFTSEQGFALCAEAMLADEGVGTLLVILTSLAHDYAALTPWLEKLTGRARAEGKQIALAFLSSSDGLAREARLRLQHAGVLVLPSADRVVAALGARAWAARPLPAGEDASPARADDGGADFLATAGVPLPGEALCRTLDEAQAAAQAMGWPVALKVVSPDIPHKTEAGGVALGLADASALAAAWDRVTAAVAAHAPNARITGWQVQQMASGGVEILIGCTRDPEMGPVLTVGAGGLWTEILADSASLSLPAGEAEIAAALEGLRIAPLLAGARGQPPADRAALTALARRVGDAFLHADSIREVDLNPVVVRPEGQGVLAVDSLVVRTQPDD